MSKGKWFMMRKHYSPTRRFLRADSGEGSIAIAIGAFVLLVAIVGGITGLAQVSDSSSRTSINSQRKQALQGIVTDYFNKVNWTEVLSDSTLGITVHDQKTGPLAACSSDPCKAVTNKGVINFETARTFPYYAWVTPAINTLRAVDTDGTTITTNINNYGTINADDVQANLTNSDGSYRIQLVAPAVGKNLSDCLSVLNSARQNKPPLVKPGCIYVSGLRTPTFSDSAVAGDWLGLISTDPAQVTGTARVTQPNSGNATHMIAKINTCEMPIPSVRVTFLWKPDSGSDLKPVSVTRYRTDGVAQETWNGLSSAAPVNGKPFMYVSDFSRGTSSLCGKADSLVVNFSGTAGSQGSITALYIVPIKLEGSITNVPGPLSSIRVQSVGDDPDGYQLVWDAPTSNTSNPATSYKIASTCNPTTVTVPASAPNVERDYTGGFISLNVSGQPIIDYMNSCPVWSIVPVGVNGDGPRSSISLGSLPFDYVKAQAVYTPSDVGSEIKVSFNIPDDMRPMIGQIIPKYCYQVPLEATGCTNPFKDPSRAISFSPVSVSSTEVTIPAPADLTKVKDGIVYVQLILDPTSAVSGEGHSNIIALNVGAQNGQG